MNLIRRGMYLLSAGIRSQCALPRVPALSSHAAPPLSPLGTLTRGLSSTLAPSLAPPLAPSLAPSFAPQGILARAMASLAQMHRTGPHIKKRKSRNPLNGNPFAKGVVLKTVIKKPKKPNSANRKCVLVRLSNGKEMVSYIPGIGHNLQEHNIVLVRVGRLKDCPGVKLKCVRGKYDLPHVVKAKA